MRAALLFLVIIVSSVCSGQSIESIKGKVTDAANRPLAYVSIGVLNTAIGTVSSESGEFSLTLAANQEAIVFSLLGFKTQTIDLATLKRKNGLIQLEEAAFTLPEVRITNKEPRTKTIGSSDIKTKMRTNFALEGKPNNNLGAEIGRKFNLPKGSARLLKYRVYTFSQFKQVKFRLNIYRSKDFAPLLNRNIYFTAEYGQRWTEIDLSAYDIVVNEDIILSIQWVDASAEKGYLALPNAMPATAIHYYKYGSQDKWKKFVGMTTAMNLTIEY